MATARVRRKRALRKRRMKRRRERECALMPDRVLRELDAQPVEPKPEPAEAERPLTYREGLKRMTVGELRHLIGEHALVIKGFRRFRKAELIEAIAAAVEARNDY